MTYCAKYPSDSLADRSRVICFGKNSRKGGSMIFFWPEGAVPVIAEEIKEYMG